MSSWSFVVTSLGAHSYVRAYPCRITGITLDGIHAYRRLSQHNFFQVSVLNRFSVAISNFNSYRSEHNTTCRTPSSVQPGVPDYYCLTEQILVSQRTTDILRMFIVSKYSDNK